MKLLVTGSTGFIGNYVIPLLLEQGHEVIASSANASKASAMNWFSQVKYVPVDIRNLKDGVNYYKELGSPERLIHLAWEGLPNYKADFHLTQNLPSHFTFLKNLVENGLKDLTITGTCFEYGMQEGCLNENMPALPANPYAAAKDELRKKLEELESSFGFNLKWVRLFYMFGKGQNPNSLLSQLDRALLEGREKFDMSGGEQVRDFLPVEKVAEYLVKISLQNSVHGIINCCSGEPVTVKNFVETYLKKINRKITLNLGVYPYPDYEPMKFWGDNSRLKTILKS